MATFCAATEHSVNLPCCCGTFHQLLLPFHTAGGPSITLCKHFVRPPDLHSTSINFMCGRWTFHELPSTFRAASAGTSVTFRQHFMWPQDDSLPFQAAGVPSINFRQHSVLPGTFCQLLSPFCAVRELPSTFCAATGHFVNFCHLSVQLGDFQSTFHVAQKFPSALYSRGIIRQLPSHFRAARDHSSTLITF